jgi:predicted molibdopterin-dependent oxidoreductase YjgC
MFRRLREARGRSIVVTIDGRRVEARAGDSVAETMRAADHAQCAVAASKDRARHCTMPECFDCLVTIDGIGNRRGCLVEVRDGMRIETQLSTQGDS